MFGSLFGGKQDAARARSIIDYLKSTFNASESGSAGRSHYVKLELVMATVTVKITCYDNRINIALTGFAAGNLDNDTSLPQVQRVEEAIRSFLSGSFAAKWRKRVHIQSQANQWPD